MIDKTSPAGSWKKLLKLEMGPWRKIDENTYVNRAKEWNDVRSKDKNTEQGK